MLHLSPYQARGSPAMQTNTAIQSQKPSPSHTARSGNGAKAARSKSRVVQHLQYPVAANGVILSSRVSSFDINIRAPRGAFNLVESQWAPNTLGESFLSSSYQDGDLLPAKGCRPLLACRKCIIAQEGQLCGEVWCQSHP